ncbi:hypothetical protein VCHENC02_2999A, partial [Vibrio harveyi]
MGMILYLTGR